MFCFVLYKVPKCYSLESHDDLRGALFFHCTSLDMDLILSFSGATMYRINFKKTLKLLTTCVKGVVDCFFF